ncbi:uncharacterized protein LOC143869904 [Tasmannia lanceolata]|uniref:uncharacterized protein LOC143869904 n=1 Tax=Tasmannia lanceolata TaxID=3420 RepID=UPI004062BEDE
MCGVLMWYEERSSSAKQSPFVRFTMCCEDGKIQLLSLPEMPQYLKELHSGQYDTRYTCFKELIRAYNSMFSFTSMGGVVDYSVVDGRRPYSFRISSSNYHQIGTLLPRPNCKPMFAQLYVYDPKDEIRNRVNAIHANDGRLSIEENIVRNLTQMLDYTNPYVQSFRYASEFLKNDTTIDLRIRLIEERYRDGRQYNLPTVPEVAVLMVGDGSENVDRRDVIICNSEGFLQKISDCHPAYMPLQYHLLFPFGEDGWRFNIPIRSTLSSTRPSRKNVSMQEFDAYPIQYRRIEGSTLIESGRLFQQFVVDAYAAIEEQRLYWVRKHQGQLRGELYQGLQDAVDLFITFTYNSKWKEITSALELIPRQKVKDKLDSSKECLILRKNNFLMTSVQRKSLAELSQGPDRATIVFGANSSKMSDRSIGSHQNKDEVKQYLDCRYVSAPEACWRILEFDMQGQRPFVERLQFHLPNEQYVIFNDKDNLCQIVENPNVRITMFTKWMETNKKYDDVTALTYVEFPTAWVWDREEKEWHRHKKRESYWQTVFCSPIVSSSYENIRTINGILYPDFKSACASLGLLEDDNEWLEALVEASIWASANQLRHLFASILISCNVTNPLILWKNYYEALSEDIQLRTQRHQQNPKLLLPADVIQDTVLEDIESILNCNGKSLSNYPPLPLPTRSSDDEDENKLIWEESNHDQIEAMTEFQHLHEGLNSEQLEIFDAVIDSCDNTKGDFYFVYGSGSTGKTYLWKTLIYKLRSSRRIVLTVASSGIAVVLLPSGRTAHSCFKIPLELNDTSTCTIPQQSELAELIRKGSLIIWDYAPMIHRYSIESIDRTLKDLLKKYFN